MNVDPWKTDAFIDPADAAAPHGDEAREPEPAAWSMTPSGWSDPDTSTDGPRYWDRMISSERARARRSHRPATIVFVEIEGLEDHVVFVGAESARSVLINAGRTLTQQVRASDCVARIAMARFAVFLPETNEIEAINFVERARSAIETAILAGGDDLRVAMGWASPANGDLDVALTVAEERLANELRGLR